MKTTWQWGHTESRRGRR